MASFVFHGIACAGPGGVVRPCVDITVENGRIASIEDAVPGRNPSGGYDGSGKIALPGFYNIHSHIPMTLLRGYGEGLQLKEWLFGKMIPFEALLTDEDCYWGSLLGIAEMLASGTVSFTDMYMHMPGIVKAVSESGIKANLSHGFSSRIPGQPFLESTAYEGWQAVREAEASAKGRIVADASIHAEYTTDTESTVRDIADWSRGEGLRMHVHISETRREHEECKTRRGGMTPTAFFERCGIFDSPTTAAHCVWAEDADLDILASRGVTVAHCPSSNLKLGSGIARIARMVDLGVNVGIGTDGAASNNNLDMLEEMVLASLVQKGVTGDPTRFGPGEMLSMACRNGALSQGRADCGELAPGNRADIVIFDLHAPHLQPVYDPLVNVASAARASDIRLTMVDGEVLYRDGKFPTIDVERVMAEAGRIKEEKLARLAGSS